MVEENQKPLQRKGDNWADTLSISRSFLDSHGRWNFLGKETRKKNEESQNGCDVGFAAKGSKRLDLRSEIELNFENSCIEEFVSNDKSIIEKPNIKRRVP